MQAPLAKDRVSIRALGALLLAVLCWGMAPVATRYLLAFFTPLQLVLMRFMISSLFLLPLLAPLRTHHWKRREIAWVIFCGLTGVIGYNVPIVYGLRTVPASIGGLLIATEPIWIMLIAALTLHEKVSWPVLCGMLLSLCGVILFFSQESFGPTWDSALLTGALLILLAALMWSIYTVSMRVLSKELGARSATALTLIVGTLPLFAFWDNRPWPLLLHLDTPGWLAIALLTLGSTVAATILWNYGVSRVKSSQAGLFLYLVTLVSVTGGTILLHERIGLLTLLSGLLIISGVALAQFFRPTPS